MWPPIQFIVLQLLFAIVLLLSFSHVGAKEIPEQDRIHIGNMTCDYYEQPLNHFYVPREKSPTYKQRYCYYDKYVKDPINAPIFFYTGNESPIEQYINNTGLMWELAPEFNAQVIFVEHRYEGQSLPAPSIPNCMSYSSSKQAIEDYARFLEYWLLNSTLATQDKDNGIIHRRPIIAFGGSYGGMLASWFRMKYPQLITGAIAASAPIWGLPRTNPNLIDGSVQIVKRGLQMPYPPTKSTQTTTTPNHCVTNLRATWPLLEFLANATTTTTTTSSSSSTTISNNKEEKKKKTHHPGLAKLTEWFRLCKPLKKVEQLMNWASTPWFDMSEGSFPYASSYIPFSLIDSNGTILKLPPWPLQHACWNASSLHQDWGVVFEGNRTDLRYDITYGNSNLTIEVDWDKAQPTSSDYNLDEILASSQIEGLLTSVRDAVAVWYNITHEEPCFNLTPANNLQQTRMIGGTKKKKKLYKHRSQQPQAARTDENPKEEETTAATTTRLRHLQLKKDDDDDDHNATAMCEERIGEGSWPALCCNEEMNMMVTEAQGMGRDIFWPPNYARGTKNHADVARQDAQRSTTNQVPGYCLDPTGVFGYSQQPIDPWSTRLDTYYGGRSIQYFSNIVFSNGLLDPWMAGGVHNLSVEELNPIDPFKIPTYNGPMVIPIGHHSESNMISLIIELGGHHTDLMYSSDADPDCVTKARQVERDYIAKWIGQVQEHNNN